MTFLAIIVPAVVWWLLVAAALVALWFTDIGRYFVRRIMLTLPTFLLLMLMTFIAIRMIPGDPVEVRVGDRVRMWVLDVGPNSSLAFHVVGTQFDTVWSEGAYRVLRGASTDGRTAGTTGAQVLSLLPAEGGFVEFVPLEAGHYAFVNHEMSLAEKGAHGQLAVSD